MDSSAHTPISSNPNDIFLSSSPLVPALDVLGSAALNSTKPKELTPPDDSPVDSARAADVSLPSDAHLLGSAALNSSNPKDFLPSGGVEASASDVIAPAVDENAALDASVDAPVISRTAVEVQGRRAIFSDARLGALGEGEDAPVLGLHSVAPEHVHSASAPASAAAPEMDAMNAPAPEGGEAHIFTAYGLHVPTPGARIQGEPQAVGAADGHEDGSGAAHKPGTHELDTHGEHRDGSGDAQGKGKGRRSRLVANVKEKMHVG
ncbi:hypothetical protein B0H13DRAFT_2363801 [Mycena leptocephala]|nr:hypothetical protein B0H13DRAFT_2363801 [Mycena leptocephala]